MDDKHCYLSDEDLAAYLDGNVGEDVVSQLLSEVVSDPKVAEIIGLSPRIDLDVAADRERLLPMRALAAANPDNLCSFECETFILQRLGIDIDHWSLLEEAKANNWLKDDGAPLHHVGKLLELKGLYVERKYDTSIADLKAALDAHRQVIVIIDKNMLDEYVQAKSPSFHAIYVTCVTDDRIEHLDLASLSESSIDAFTFKRAWRSSGNYMISASLNPYGYNPQPIDVNDIDLDAGLEELTEAIAENAHDIWARNRMDEGWTYGPVRDDALLKHPDLVPYSFLPESEKEYDRLMAMNTLRLVRRLGFDITNRHDPQSNDN